MSVIRAFIALGANLGNPEAQVQSAIAALGTLPHTRLVRASSLYRSAPVGYADQPDFLNAVAEVATVLAPRELLDALLALELSCGRVRDFPNAPRTLDLDIILYGGLVLHEHGLTIPHPRMHERAFVLVPLAEIAPDVIVPGRGVARDLLAGVDVRSVERVVPVQAGY
jgi:2-amino-4-hydroxy-6-hydroxymethyldihydropteridine diphosphokinase